MTTTTGQNNDTPAKPNVTLHWDGESGDGKRAFVLAKENDGWSDLRIEVDTDDCDSDHAKAAMQVVIDRCNSHEALRAALAKISDEAWSDGNAAIGRMADAALKATT